ncbi:transporter substrate-binding domain-containing protein [Aurantimonas sp. C2-6-R+9]|uniref:transporter substrate-binding domain-containing protein n=1 Tax=unclassified Aurantimonas TaxID=2638230 RepID=UPI002E1792C5|nr:MULTISPECIES: transporter substrate-binding domain-containing protein [unclassified Aurantimonas]MEC5293372.1 transporter substrate-binding domain-containing protein [Aurantimonas sp. C2-3-R2]MEC5383554.1 transporter substrate-binding domain-containing protein [Aurantimonas sp. C2-6-R+9]MEC5414447.1 transporter substrate-binding domain-containing protein [Aurantimonas sp. C2-4-R8]
MLIHNHPIGILFSATGSYGTVGRTMLNGALMACAEVNADPHSPVRLDPLVIDPGCELSAYAAGVKTMFDRGIRQVVGCYTSSSRKEVIPIFEKCDALLWYPTHYEGFESSANVVYTGTAPNHHLSPLIDYLVSRFGRRAFCIGSNYIWGWESNRVLREDITQRGGTVLAERYLALGDTDFRSVIGAIFDSGPDFVFNALVGRSAYAFFREFRAACTARGIDQKSRYPIASCNLSEPELSEIGPDAIDGHLSSSVYFSSIDTPTNRAFVAGYNRMFPAGPAVSAEAEAAYIATKFLAVALVEAGTDELQNVKAAVQSKAFDAPQGRVTIDPETMHAYLTPRIGRSRRDGQFDILVEAEQPVRPDPYLVRASPSHEAVARRPNLRVV